MIYNCLTNAVTTELYLCIPVDCVSLTLSSSAPPFMPEAPWAVTSDKSALSFAAALAAFHLFRLFFFFYSLWKLYDGTKRLVEYWSGAAGFAVWLKYVFVSVPFDRTPLSMAVWSLTCFFVSASNNKWIRALYPNHNLKSSIEYGSNITSLRYEYLQPPSPHCFPFRFLTYPGISRQT